MKFYDCKTAPSPKRARMFIAEKGLDVETINIDLNKGEQFKPEFTAINPSATVPVLVTEDGTGLTENLAIAAYLEAKYPETPLMGRTAEEKALVLMWNSLVDFQFGMPVADVLRNSHPAMAGRAITGVEKFDQIPELAARGKTRVDIFYDRLETQLEGRDYLAADHFTLADISAFVLVAFAAQVKMPIPEANKATQRWFAMVSERPSAAV